MHYLTKPEPALQPGIMYLKKLADLIPDNEDILLYYGTACRLANDAPSAIEAYKKLIHLNPKHTRALAQLGYAYKTNHNLEQAVKYLSQAVNQILQSKTPLEEETQGYLSDLLRLLVQQKSYNWLLTYAEKAVQQNISPQQNGLFYLNMGIAYKGMQKYVSAVEYFEKSKALGHILSLEQTYELGQLYIILGKLKNASVEFGVVANQSPDNPVPHGSYAVTLRLLGHVSRAFKHAKLAHTLDPKGSSYLGEYLLLLRYRCLFKEFNENYEVIQDAMSRRDYAYLEAFTFSGGYMGWPMALLHKHDPPLLFL